MNINNALQWYRERVGRVYYSMVYRNGQVINGRPNFDCSSALTYALIQGGYFANGHRIGNTDTLFGDLEAAGWVQLQPNAQGNFDTKAGDVFIWGRRGASGGSAGHTGMFSSADNILHCSGGYNGIHEDNYDWLRSINGYPEQTFYRYSGKPQPAPVSNDPNDQDLEVGSWIKFPDTFTADEVTTYKGVDQVRTNVLCRTGFTWDDNGIPTEPLVEVDSENYSTVDQNLENGSLYKLPGKYQVLELGNTDGMWLAKIEAAGMKFWVDVATAIEIPSNAAGTPVPSTRPVQVPSLPPTVPVNPVDPTIPTVPINEPANPETGTEEPSVPVKQPEPVIVGTQTFAEFLKELLDKLVKFLSTFKRSK